MATVPELAGKQRQEYSTSEQHHENLRRLAYHMYEISDDPSGSKPSLYLSRTNTRTLEQFLEMADKLSWPDAEPIIDMRSGRIEGLPAWTSSLRTAKTGLTKALFFPKISDTQRGYLFAKLNVTPTQQVAICKDGFLRSRRSTELTRSKGIGWGRLPDPEYLLAAIDPVKVLLDYAPFKSLDEKLLSRIQPENLRRYIT